MDVKKLVTDLIEVQSGKPKDNIKPESKFKEDLGMDSLESVELVMAVEEKFDISLPDEDMDKILTVEQLVQYVEKVVLNEH